MIILADYILNGLSSLLRGAINVLPVNVAGFSLAQYQATLNNLKQVAIKSFSLTSHFFPYTLFFNLLLAMIVVELALVIFKIIKWTINVFRGSGG